MSKPTKYAAQEKYASREQAKGNIRVAVWIPKERKQEITRLAKKMRQGLA